MKNKILLMAIGMALGWIPVAAEAATNPFVPNGSVTINSMPQSENPIWTPPLASPSVTSSGILSAFYSSSFLQSNPNSPQPVAPACTYGGPGTSTGSYVWSGSDNTGWVLQGADCATSAQPTAASCQYGGSAGSYTWNGSSWVLSGQSCNAPPPPPPPPPAPVVNNAFIGGGSPTTAPTSAPTSAPTAAPTAATILWYKPVVTHGLNYHMANNTGKTIPQYSGTDPYPTLYTVLERFGNAIQFNTLTGTVTYGRCFIHSNPCRFYIPSH